MAERPRRSRAYYVALFGAVVSMLVFVALTIAQMYVRWYLNQDFTFLGGFGLEAWGAVFLGLTLGALWYDRA